MVKLPPKCPRCKSQMVLEYGTWKCLNDDQELSDRAARHRFYDDNRENIIKDYNQGGASQLKDVWGISNSTWLALRKRWQIPLRIKRQPRKVSAPQAIPSAESPGKNGLPPLPVFRDSWATEVQVKWLEVWAMTDKVT